MSRQPNCKCAECGDHYHAARISTGNNYCSTACRSKAYRERKKRSDLAKKGTFDMDTYSDVQRLRREYGEKTAHVLMSIYEDSGANALRLAIYAIDLITGHESDYQLAEGKSA